MDENRRPIPGTEMVFDCDTILLSVGLIPENELTSGAHITLDPRTKGPVVFENMETSAPGEFACGNVVHVHDLVDFVTAESQRAGAAAARYASGRTNDGPAVEIQNGEGVGYTVPQKVRPAAVDKKLEIFFRVRRVYGNSAVVVESGGQPLARFKREHLAPGEMEHITLPAALLAKAKGALEVAVEEEQA